MTGFTRLPRRWQPFRCRTCGATVAMSEGTAHNEWHRVIDPPAPKPSATPDSRYRTALAEFRTALAIAGATEDDDIDDALIAGVVAATTELRWARVGWVAGW